MRNVSVSDASIYSTHAFIQVVQSTWVVGQAQPTLNTGLTNLPESVSIIKVFNNVYHATEM